MPSALEHVAWEPDALRAELDPRFVLAPMPPSSTYAVREVLS